jgi:TRAP-type C4-dicarboxylate transport system permease small subunit
VNARLLYIVGGCSLLAAMAIETVTVLVRNAGITIYGSIEMVEAAILISSSCALIVATLNRSHAKVRILHNRLSGNSRKYVDFLNNLCSAFFFLALTVGQVWIASDMWNAYEQSEVLAIPYFPLRCAALVATFVTGLAYLYRLTPWGKP